MIAIFTKFDALDDKAYGDLEKEGMPWEEARRQAPVRAVADFEKEHLDSIYHKRKYPPKGHVYLRGMIHHLYMLQGHETLCFCFRYERG